MTGPPTEMGTAPATRQNGPPTDPGTAPATTTHALSELYTTAYLILFAILGTLARVGLTALTTYPGAPVTFGVVWANFGGCVVMGFLVADRGLFRTTTTASSTNDSAVADKEQGRDESAKSHLAFKKTLPLYNGLATGFCGSFTSFSSFVADAFLAISNDLVSPAATHDPSRAGGYSFMALLGVLLSNTCLSLGGLFAGAHLAAALGPWTPSLRYASTRRVLDPLAVFLGWGCWVGAVAMAAVPPHDAWRGRVLFALVFAPLGCMARYYLSAQLNGRAPSFPLGTFAANVGGTAVLGMTYDLAHVPLGGVVGCQVLQGVQDGFCGCLTTVSTWVVELTTLPRRGAYVYGVASVVAGLVVMIAIMGGLRWTDGFHGLMCT